MTANFGWTYDQGRIEQAVQRMEAAGYTASFAADRPTMNGYWKRQQSRGVVYLSAQDDELKLNGKWRDPNHQVRGVCVKEGSERAIEDVHISRIVDGEIIGKSTEIVGEVMYGYERNTRWGKTQPWGTPGQCNDGLQGVDAAAFFTMFGALARGIYEGYDLSKSREDLAIKWNNDGVPMVLLAASKFHKLQCHTSRNWNEFADAIAAKYWGFVCLPQVFGFEQVIRGPYGTVRPDANGGHCTECCGIFTLPNGDNGFHMQNSWGNGIRYPKEVETINGPVKLRPGSYVVRQSVLEAMGNQVELISVDIPSASSFREMGQ